MKKNQLLSFATLFLKLMCLITIIGVLASAVMLVHWHFNPDYYAKINMVGTEGSTFGYSVKTTWATDDHAYQETPFALNNIKPLSLYLIYIQLSAISLILFLLYVEVIRIIDSVKIVQSFRKRNVSSFRKIGKLLFALSLLLSFKIVKADMGYYHGFFVHFTPLILMLTAFILSEIFKEGNALLEENKFTV